MAYRITRVRSFAPMSVAEKEKQTVETLSQLSEELEYAVNDIDRRLNEMRTELLRMSETLIEIGDRIAVFEEGGLSNNG